MIYVIIPTYKPQKYIYECISSVVAQDFNEDCFRIVVVLNGAKEPYYSAINEYIRINQYKNIDLIHTPLIGVSNARNIGLDLAKPKDYIIFVDDDDKISSNYISSLYSNIQDGYICLSNEKTFYTDSHFLESSYLSIRRKDLLQSNRKSFKIINFKSFLSVVWGKIIPMNIIGDNRFDTNFQNGEDALFMASISDKIKFIYFSQDSAIYYRRLRNNSLSQKKRTISRRLVNSIKLFVGYLNIYLKKPFDYSFIFFLNRFFAVFKTLFVKDF